MSSLHDFGWSGRRPFGRRGQRGDLLKHKLPAIRWSLCLGDLLAAHRAKRGQTTHFVGPPCVSVAPCLRGEFFRRALSAAFSWPPDLVISCGASQHMTRRSAFPGDEEITCRPAESVWRSRVVSPHISHSSSAAGTDSFRLNLSLLAVCSPATPQYIWFRRSGPRQNRRRRIHRASNAKAASGPRVLTWYAGAHRIRRGW